MTRQEQERITEKLLDTVIAGNRKDMDFINANTDKLLADYRDYKNKLERLKESKDNGAGKDEIPADELKEAYEALKEVIPQMDYDSVEMILDQLKEYRLPEEDQQKMEELGKMLKVLDWDGMEKVIG